MSHRRIARDESGLSLLEVLFAALMLTLLGVPMFASLGTGHKGSERIIEESVAAYIGSSLVEKLGRVPYSKLPVLPGDVVDLDLSAEFADRRFAPFIEPYPDGYARFVSIQEISRKTEDPAGPGNSRWGDIKQITVRVTWKPDYLKKKSERSLVFRTMVTNDTEVW